LIYYNTAWLIRIKEDTAFTGGTDENGRILSIGEDIIRRKLRGVFYSNISSFVIPKQDESFTLSEFSKLQKKYPDRKLKIISVDDIYDVLNRRDIIEIKRQKIAVRTGKFIRNNWVSAAAAVLMTLLLSLLFIFDFDDNPANLNCDGSTLFVRNIKEKILWTIPFHVKQDNIRDHARLIDIDQDGKNEILINSDLLKLISCYDKYGNEIWNFKFEDKVISTRMDFLCEYSSKFIDTSTFNGFNSLFIIATNVKAFSSAVFE
jgi:hypothetical protein